MSAPGDIHYARTRDGIDIAYTEFGQGPDLLVAPGFVTHLDLMWDFPFFAGIRALGDHFHVIVLDKRGTGLSDRSLGFGSLEDRTEDIRAVLDAASSEQAILYGMSESGPMAIYFAASNPSRVRALLLYGSYAKFDAQIIPHLLQHSGPVGDVDALETYRDEFVQQLEHNWGKGLAYQAFLSHAPDPAAAQRVLARFERSACTPQMCREIMTQNFRIDVTPFLASIAVPSLVLHCGGDPVLPVAYGRYLRDHIPGARYVEIDGDFHGSWRSEDAAKIGLPVTAFLQEVVGGEEATTTASADREVATVLFTDIVRSTERAAEVGDSAWKALLDQHESTAAQAVAAAGGRLVKTTGDGMVATFAGPSHAVATARALQDAALPLGVGVRAGLHTGEIERRGDDIGGLGVHIAARIAAIANAGEILVSRTARDLAVGSHIRFDDRGTHALKGVPDQWQLYAAQ